MLGLFVKRVPSWAAWSTVVVGFAVSFTIKNVLDPDLFRQLLGLNGALNDKESNFYFYLASVLANVVIAGGWFLGTTCLLQGRFRSLQGPHHPSSSIA